jgi:hypothetical protein
MSRSTDPARAKVAPPTLADIDGRALRFERDRRALIDAVIAAHLDTGVSANNLAHTLNESLSGPGWGRDRVLALLAAARNERAAHTALADYIPHRLAVWADVYGEHGAIACELVARSPDPITSEDARRILAALATVGLTVDEAALVDLSSHADRDALPLTRIKS